MLTCTYGDNTPLAGLAIRNLAPARFEKSKSGTALIRTRY